MTYTGDMILTSRLYEFIFEREWNDDEVIDLDAISCAIHEATPEQSLPYGDMNCPETIIFAQDNDWHLGRIIYFINNPGEIRDIEIDNLCNGMDICPIPIITDGNHRFMAAAWLNDQGIACEKIHVKYGGRKDLLQYLKGETDIMPID